MPVDWGSCRRNSTRRRYYGTSCAACANDGPAVRVNFILHFPNEESVAICLQERCLFLASSGDPAPYVERAHAAGLKVCYQVGSVDAAQRAAQAG